MNPFRKATNAVLDWFTPDQMKTGARDQKHVRMFQICHLISPIITLPILLFLVFEAGQTSLYVWGLAALFTLYWSYSFVLKLFPNWFSSLALISTQTLLFTILWGAYHYGGMNSPFFMWILVVPMLGFLYLGSSARNQIAIFGQLLINLLIFYGYRHLIPSEQTGADLPEMVVFGEVLTLVALALVYLISRYYANGVSHIEEITEELRQNRAALALLTNAKDDAERANSAKSEFLAKMSHELRTPLNAVLGYSEILLEDAEADGRAEEIADLQRISAAGKHLLSMVNDILDISKIEAGKAELYLESFNLEQFFGEVETTARPLAAKNANEFVFEKSGDLGSVHMDTTKLRQSVLNLLSNASKFTDGGKITMRVERQTLKDGDWIVISVRDTGIGISEENLDNLFRNFSQANASITAKFGGTGLGLSLSQNLCQMMGGEITVESKLGVGSCFSIRLPAHVEAVAPIVENVDEPEIGSADILTDDQSFLEEVDQNQLDQAIQELRDVHSNRLFKDETRFLSQPGFQSTVLVIDDDEGFLEVAKRVIEKEGYRAVCTTSPESVLRLALTVRPEVILLDVVMPDMDGWDVLATLSSEQSTAHIPVFMISSAANRKRVQENQAVGFIEKPLDGEKLNKLFELIKTDGLNDDGALNQFVGLMR